MDTLLSMFTNEVKEIKEKFIEDKTSKDTIKYLLKKRYNQVYVTCACLTLKILILSKPGLGHLLLELRNWFYDKVPRGKMR